VGTPDFSASAVLRSQYPGPRDDLEALGYTLLELALGELPWWVWAAQAWVWLRLGVGRPGASWPWRAR